MKVSLRTLLLLLYLGSAGVIFAQEEEPAAAVESSQEASELELRLETLADLLASISNVEGEIEGLEKAHRDAETEEQKHAVSLEIEEQRLRLGELESDFSVLAAGLDAEIFFQPTVEKFDWHQELEAIFSPLIAELKEASAYPRELETLRSELVACERRLPQIEEAVASLTQLRGVGAEENVARRLDEQLEFWTAQRDEAQTRCQSAEQLLQEKEQDKEGISHATAEVLRIFFKKRFLNLLFALLAFVVIFLVLRFLHRLAHRHMPSGGSHSRQLMMRLADIAYYLFTVVVAVAALLVALYLSADWVLLTLAIFLILGLAWATRAAVPQFLEQAKLLLNIGAVREGERVIYGEIPWRVSSLSLFSELQNPELRGGSLRLPIKDLVKLRSRRGEDDEPWFPSRLGDWVICSDDTYGEVVEQTPEVVILSTVRGSYKSYPTVDYLHQHPKNLSINFFSVNHTVSLDYSYRDIFNTDIAPKLRAAIEEGMRAQPYGEHLVQVIAELKTMGESSLDAITIAKFKGGAASEYFEIGWKLQQLALDACNENGWDIPFPQLVIHRDGA